MAAYHNNVCKANRAVLIGRNALLALQDLIDSRGGRSARRRIAAAIFGRRQSSGGDEADHDTNAETDIDYSDLLGTSSDDEPLSVREKAFAAALVEVVVLVVPLQYVLITVDTGNQSRNPPFDNWFVLIAFVLASAYAP